MGIHIIGMVKHCKDCALGRAQTTGIVQTPVGENVFDISSPLPHTCGSKKHWLLIVEDSTDFA